MTFEPLCTLFSLSVFSIGAGIVIFLLLLLLLIYIFYFVRKVLLLSWSYKLVS